MPHDEAMRSLLASFDDPEAAKRYRDGPQRFVPGLAELYRMTAILLAERVPQDARVLVLGAGGGLELRALADARPGWTFVGVDPAAAMLEEAKRLLGPDAARVEFCKGYIDDAPKGPFDAAICLLTLHFLKADERTRTVREIHRRLKPAAPFVAAHSSFPQGRGERALWLSRYAAFAVASGADPEQVEKMRAAVDAHLPVLDPEQDDAVLREAGFGGVSLFYAALTWRGWIAYA
ncbi:class I SAM-dependent methyltransferase [Reyranella sp.]|uniref:class I SAM-dependent methyltransferase n=1 Tax=Reyranella sp. TaxID=1929291 RepID=UPI003D097FDF